MSSTSADSAGRGRFWGSPSRRSAARSAASRSNCGRACCLRNGRGAVPTEAGKRLLEHARGILQQVDRARREVDETKDAPVGHVVVGLPPTVARHLTLPVVREFRQRYPGGSLRSSKDFPPHPRMAARSAASTSASSTTRSPHRRSTFARCSRSSSASSPPARRARRRATLRLRELAALPAHHSQPAQCDPHAGGDAARRPRPAAAGGDGDRRGAGDPRARRRRSRLRGAVAACAARCDAAPRPPRARPSSSRALRARSPSSPRRSARRRRSSSATIEMIESLVGPALAARLKARGSRRDSPPAICLNRTGADGGPPDSRGTTP